MNWYSPGHSTVNNSFCMYHLGGVATTVLCNKQTFEFTLTKHLNLHLSHKITFLSARHVHISVNTGSLTQMQLCSSCIPKNLNFCTNAYYRLQTKQLWHCTRFLFSSVPYRCVVKTTYLSMLASGTQDRGSKPGRSRRIFSGRKKSWACLPSEGK
jgi:hypothetical protein